MPEYKDKKTGKWFCKFYYKDHKGQRQQKKKSGFDTKRAARQWEDEFLVLHSDQNPILFSVLVDEYLNDLEINTAHNTVRSQKSHVKNHIGPFFNDMCIVDITALNIREWQNLLKQKKVAGKSLKPSTLRSINNTLTIVFNYCERYYNIPSPHRKVKLIGTSKPDNDENFLTIDEYKLLRDKGEDDPILQIMYDLLFWTGMRIGELFALSREDFDLSNGIVSIKRQYSSELKLFAQQKTDNSVRVNTLPVQLVKKLKEFFDAYSLDGRLFICSETRLRRRLKKACKTAGVKVITPHGFRHSQVSLLIDLDKPVTLIAKRIGDSPETVLRVYGHLYDNKDQKLADEYNNLWG